MFREDESVTERVESTDFDDGNGLTKEYKVSVSGILKQRVRVSDCAILGMGSKKFYKT